MQNCIHPRHAHVQHKVTMHVQWKSSTSRHTVLRQFVRGICMAQIAFCGRPRLRLLSRKLRLFYETRLSSASISGQEIECMTYTKC